MLVLDLFTLVAVHLADESALSRQKLFRAREIVEGVGKMKEDRACPLNSR
jgi:hypothetical protein